MPEENLTNRDLYDIITLIAAGGVCVEAVLFIIVVTVLCLCLGVDAAYIVFGILCLLALGVILMFILFAYSLICMLFSQKTKAEFVRIDKNGKINSAFYLIDGVEYPCMFQAKLL